MLCRICMDRSLDTALFPCGHAVACLDCARRCERCPLCRADIDHCRTIYLPIELTHVDKINLKLSVDSVEPSFTAKQPEEIIGESILRSEPSENDHNIWGKQFGRSISALLNVLRVFTCQIERSFWNPDPLMILSPQINSSSRNHLWSQYPLVELRTLFFIRIFVIFVYYFSSTQQSTKQMFLSFALTVHRRQATNNLPKMLYRRRADPLTCHSLQFLFLSRSAAFIVTGESRIGRSRLIWDRRWYARNSWCCDEILALIAKTKKIETYCELGIKEWNSDN